MHTPGPLPVGAGSLVAGRFRLDDLLGEHAGVRLWRATDLVLARNVAVHVVPADDPRAAAALTAARTSAAVSDGRVLRVLDALEEDAHVSVVHEWGSGLSLDRLVAVDPLPARRAAWLVREVAEAIAGAHRRGIAHGRLLPETVMVNDAGAVKLAGFVVDAVLLGRGEAGGSSTSTSSSASPAGEGADDEAPAPLSEHESDVRNLGGLLYAALTGRWPGTPESVLPSAPLAERGLVCRPRQVRSGVPRALDALCDRVLNGSGHGAAAVESAAQVSEALSLWLGEPVPGTAVTSAGLLLGDEAHPWDAAAAGVDPDPEATVATPPVQPHAAPVTAPAGPEAGSGDPDLTQAWQPPAHGMAAVAPPPPRTAPPPTTRSTPSTPTTQFSKTGDATATAPARSDVPVHWGPDRPEEPPAHEQDEPRSGLPWLRLAAVLAALTLAVLAVVVAFDLGSTPSGSPDGDPTSSATSASPTPTRPVALTVTSFDPDDQSGGPPQENQDEVPLATDGDPTTAWTTETYRDGPPLAPYKRGVGLLLDLGEPLPVRSVTVTLLGGGHDLSVLAAPADATAAPTDVTGLTRVGREVGVDGPVRVQPTDLTTRWLVVWLTALPVSGSGYRGQVGEVVVRS